MVITYTDVTNTLWLSKWVFMVDQWIGHAETLWLKNGAARAATR